MISDEVALALAQFFDRIGPSHDEITLLVTRAGFKHLDPNDGPEVVGKMKRVRTILLNANRDSKSADQLVRAFVDALRSHGSFVPASPDFPGAQRVEALQRAFTKQGYVLSADGGLVPSSLDALEGVELTAALEAYAHRSLRGAEDRALLVGNGKDLIEATARLVIEESSGAAWTSPNFDATIWQAFAHLDLARPHPQILTDLSDEPGELVEQALWILAVGLKRWRNAVVTGHGRPSLPKVGADDAILASQAAGLVARFMLDHRQRRSARRAA